MCEKEIEKLRVEKEKVERQLAQEQHNKQRRECVLDEHRKRIRDEAGNVFNAVPTTDWGKPETLEAWRRLWAGLCNARFAEKGLDCRIDYRSYERQGVEQLSRRP